MIKYLKFHFSWIKISFLWHRLLDKDLLLAFCLRLLYRTLVILIHFFKDISWMLQSLSH